MEPTYDEMLAYLEKRSKSLRRAQLKILDDEADMLDAIAEEVWIRKDMSES